MSSDDPLGKYKEKRDFTETPEPKGETFPKSGELIYVIQKHAARNLHYDLRLENNGVLKSWAIPKGPSLDPKVKRLAIPTEDHPMGYADFEGVIPPGNYGAGTVIVWDWGSFRNMKGDTVALSDSLDEGHATVELLGEKLRGGYALIRVKGKSPRWLFFKMKDEHAVSGSDILEESPNSVKSGKSLEQVAEQWPAELEDFS